MYKKYETCVLYLVDFLTVYLFKGIDKINIITKCIFAAIIPKEIDFIFQTKSLDESKAIFDSTEDTFLAHRIRISEILPWDRKS